MQMQKTLLNVELFTVVAKLITANKAITASNFPSSVNMDTECK